jgi:hypothetical protein
VSSRRWIALWGAFLAALTALMTPFGVDTIQALLLGGAALGTFALAVVIAPGRSPASARGSSLPAVAAALGIALLVVGSEVGPWLVAVGAGLLVLSVGMLATERRSG